MDYREYYAQRSRDRKANKKKRRIKPRFFAFLFVFAAVVVGVVLLAVKLVGGGAGGDTYTVVYGRYGVKNDGYNAMVIREEYSYRVNSYSTIDYMVGEGADVTANQLVMNVYADGYLEQVRAELQSVRAQIVERQESSLLQKIVDEQLSALDARVLSALNAMIDYSNGKPSAAVAELEGELSAAMRARQDYLKQTSVAQTDATLAALYDTEAQLEARTESWRTAYYAAAAGRVSYYFDGLESVLGVGVLGNLDCNTVSRLVAGEKPTIPSDITSQESLYRLVTTDRWYVVFVANSSDWTTVKGQNVSIILDGYDGGTVSARVYDVAAEDDKSLITLEMSSDIGSLIGARFTRVELAADAEGLIVPRSAVKLVGGRYGVYTTDEAFVEVEILASDSVNYLVLPAEEGALDKGSVIKAK